MVPFLAETRSFMNMFILNSVMLKADTQIKLLKIDLTDKNLYKPGENIDIGMGAKLYLSTYKRSPKFIESFSKSFLGDIRRPLSGLGEHMLEKSPLTHSFTRLAGAISPNIMSIKSNSRSCEAEMAKLLLKLVNQERISVKEGDEATSSSQKLLATVEEERCLNCNKSTDRLDTFYAKLFIAC